MKQRLLIVSGPTASGKTSVACAIAKKLPVEMISCDSMQVYRGLPVLTQAPGASEKRILKAHLVSFLEPSKKFDAAKFRKEALSLIGKILQRGRVPLICGGTGLYLRALLDGLFESEAPQKNERLRKKLWSDQEKHGGNYLHDRLRRVDPVSAGKIHPNDWRRLVRALEVHELTGRPLSERKTQRSGIRDRFDCPIFFLERDREDLYTRIERRVDAMVKQGLVREVKRALQTRLSATASMALGIREVAASLKGEIMFEEALLQLKQHTRNYAKRQIAWFRHEKGVVMVPVGRDETPVQTARKILKSWEDDA